MLKKIEQFFKHALLRILLLLIRSRRSGEVDIKAINKILVFRLDSRIGNGLLLLPLMRAIRASNPTLTLDFLFHAPVAQFISQNSDDLIDTVWLYGQKKLLTRPWRFLQLFGAIRAKKYDIVITAHNPDNFSLSQALAARWFKPTAVVGFDWKDSAQFYDIAVRSGTDKHYADAMVDLWRTFVPRAACRLGGVQVSGAASAWVEANFPEYRDCVLLWLGATGNKILPPIVADSVYELLKSSVDRPIMIAAGPADRAHVELYSEVLKNECLIWHHELEKSAALFAAAALFISPDTGPMHLATAVGVKTLTIFINSNIQQYGYHDGDRHFAFQVDASNFKSQPIQSALNHLLMSTDENKSTK